MAPTSFGFADRKALHDYIDRRMEAHKALQHAVEYALIEEILDEVQTLPPRRPKTARLFEIDTENVFGLEARQ